MNIRPRKYEKVTKDDYIQWHQEQGELRERVSQDPDRLAFHLMPETGWLNDPNGLCQINGIYHIYYQYDPFDTEGELKLWGHCTTKDFIHYESCEPVLFPDSEWDAHGVYSGSAFVEDGWIHYFYTGNVKYFDRPDYDYINSGRGSSTIHVKSRDGFHFTEKEVVLTNRDYPSDISCHVRDPKIIKSGDVYHMVLGARDKDGRGLILVYCSADLEHWGYEGRIVSEEAFGYMWECPDLFFLDSRLYLICCPQGVSPQGINYRNVHQCVAMSFEYDSESKTYCLCNKEVYHQMDRGCDFYAPQSFEDEHGRRILIGWMGIPDADYTNPTAGSGWQHALTIPRQLHVRDGRLIQEPLSELKELRMERVEMTISSPLDQYQDSRGWSGDRRRSARGSVAELDKNGTVFETKLSFDHCKTLNLTLRQGVEIRYREGILSLELGKGGYGRPVRSVRVETLQELHIFSDTTSLELFVNGGQEVFTTRVYEKNPQWRLDGECCGRLTFYQLRGQEGEMQHGGDREFFYYDRFNEGKAQHR